MQKTTKYSFIWLTIICLYCFFPGCGKPSGDQSNAESDSLKAANLIQLDDQSWCDSLDGFGICPIGIYFVQIGDSLVADSLMVPPGVGILAGKQETTVQFSDGTIHILTDSSGHVNRISIRTPAFKTRHGIHTGSELAELVALYPGVTARKPTGDTHISVIAEGAPNLVYLFQASNLDLQDSLPVVNELPQNLKIDEIAIVP